MCGIVGYIGSKEAYPIIINGLKRLEYRGYDSTGVVLYEDGELSLCKTKGKVADLEAKAEALSTSKSSIGIGHTRWATHGEPNDVNSHPHLSNSGKLAIIHNGIIENYDSIKTQLKNNGFIFHSDTDTEVLINLIEYVKQQEGVKLGKAVQIALKQVIGAYAIAVFDVEKPNEIIAAKLGSPLAIGIGEGEYFIASDATPFIEYTKNALYLEDGEMAIIREGRDLRVRKVSDDIKIENPNISTLTISLDQIEKSGYDHFMLKEIHEQPNVVRDTLRGRLLVNEGVIKMSSIDDHLNKFTNAKRILIIACGTSWHAGLVGEYLIEELARIPVEVEYASEFRYRNPIINKDDIVIPISQSGETADTLAAIKLAKEQGAFVYGICNVVGSSIARETHSGAYTHAGPEIGVASTKAFTTQLTVLSLLAAKIAVNKGSISTSEYHKFLYELDQIPSQIAQVMECEPKAKEIAKQYADATNFLYLGRGFNFPVALEGALKLKEISYIHAEGYPAAEMKHGPIALIDENMPVVVIAPKRGHYEKIVSNVMEIKARKAKIIAIVSKGDTEIVKLADHYIEIPDCNEALTPMITTIPLQFLSYYIAVIRGCNVDQPRNLAKSVTVE